VANQGYVCVGMRRSQLVVMCVQKPCTNWFMRNIIELILQNPDHQTKRATLVGKQ